MNLLGVLWHRLDIMQGKLEELVFRIFEGPFGWKAEVFWKRLNSDFFNVPINEIIENDICCVTIKQKELLW